jgi:hypothetical protein
MVGSGLLLRAPPPPHAARMTAAVTTAAIGMYLRICAHSGLHYPALPHCGASDEGPVAGLCGSAVEQSRMIAWAFGLLGAILFIPMYATPAARQLPVMAAAIAGVRVIEPPQSWLGDYIAPGNVAAIHAWLQRPPARTADAFVISTDMLAYGGLNASRVLGGVSTAEAIERLDALSTLRAAQPHAWIAAFGTIMRLEPTAVAPVGAARTYWAGAQPPTWEYIWDYAQLHNPPLPGEQARAEQLRALIGETTLAQYLETRARDRAVDLAALQYVANGTINRLVIGQDDAGPVGLHVKDVHALRRAVVALNIADRAAIEPGADELGIVLLARAMAREIGWTPRVYVRYSTPDGAATQDPLEFAPVHVTIDALIARAGAVRDERRPDLTLYVRVPNTTVAQDDALLDALRHDIARGHQVALVDLTFLTKSYAAQAAFVRELIDAGIAGRLAAYSGWNTTANSTGIALGEAVASGVGRRTGHYNAPMHAAFMLDRYIDDYLYHDIVRPRVDATLAARGITAHWYLAPDVWRRADAQVRAELLPMAHELLRKIYPQYRAAQLDVSLPWPRTFEIESTVRLIARDGEG